MYIITSSYPIKKFAHWANEFSTDAFGEMFSIICKCRLSPKSFLKNVPDTFIIILAMQFCFIFMSNLVTLVEKKPSD